MKIERNKSVRSLVYPDFGRLLHKHGCLRVDACLLEGLLGIVLGGDEARVGEHELKVDHPPLDGYDEKAFVSETWLVSETPSSVTEN